MTHPTISLPTFEEVVFVPNHFQEDIFAFIGDPTKGNLMVIAKAGTGKTQTILEAVKLIPANKKVIILAFSKHIADELREKVPKNIEVRTTHSVGFEAIRDFNGERRTISGSKNKIYKILDKVVKVRNDRFIAVNNKSEIISNMLLNEIKTKMVHTIEQFRNTLMIVNEENLNAIAYKFELTITSISTEAKLEIIEKVLEGDRADTINIDFTDMVYLSTSMMMPFRKFDFVFVDETQDIAESQLRMLLMLKNETGRIISVGDENQAIYAFRGADTDAMNKIRLATSAEQLPLNICYRCPNTHIKLANQFVPEMEPAPDAIDGEVFVISGELLYRYIQPGDLAICRNNTPLIRPALALLKQGIKVNIRGQNLRKSLIDLIKETKTNDISKMCGMVIDYREEEVDRLKKKGKNPLSIIDKVGVILEFAQDSTTVQELINYINILLNDTDAEITFSTIHGAKGLESENIFFINSFLIPSLYAQQEWELRGEDNIMYVALTRAKKKLYFVDIHDKGISPAIQEHIENRNGMIKHAINSVRLDAKYKKANTTKVILDEEYVTEVLSKKAQGL